MKGNLVAAVARGVSRMKFKTTKYSPEILLVVGIAGGVTSVIFACKSTIKAQKILEEAKEVSDDIQTCLEDESTEYDEVDKKDDLLKMRVQTGVKLVVAYAPAIAFGALSVTSLLASHRILSKRYMCVSAAFGILQKSYKDYRARVVERYGEDVDRQLYYNLKEDTITTTVTDVETGKDKKKKEKVEVLSEYEANDYARVYDRSNPYWENTDMANEYFLNAVQNHANSQLQSRGYLFLNDVYEDLGFEHTKAGQIVGWVYDKNNNEKGDNYVDFRRHKVFLESENPNVDREIAYILDFNVDGNIWELMK